MSVSFGMVAWILIFLFALIVSGGIASFIAVSIVRRRRNSRSALCTVDAAVLSKQTATQRHPIAGDPTGAHGYTTFTSYRAVFSAADGAQHTLEMNAEAYLALSEGDRGRLTYQGTQLIAFEPNR